MASKVNVRFVVVLSAVLAMVFVGVAGAFLFVKLRSGDRYAKQAEQALARGDINTADLLYGRAVGKDNTNVTWLKKWRDVRLQKMPESMSSFQDDYDMYVHGILRTLALVQRTNVEAHREYLQEMFDRMVYAGNRREPWQVMANTADSALKYFDEASPPPELRRFRGIALVNLAGTGTEVTAEQKKTAGEDLVAALAKNPADIEAATALAIWYSFRENAAKASGNTELAKAERSARIKVMDDAVAANPGNALAAIVKLSMDAGDASASVPEGLSEPAAQAARVAALDALKPRLKAVHATVMAADPKTLVATTLFRYMNAAMGIDPAAGRDLVQEAIERALAAAPNNAELLMLRGRIAKYQNNLEAAITAYQRVVELPKLPVSLAGLVLFETKQSAMAAQANVALVIAQGIAADKPAERAAAIERAKTYRQVLAKNVPEQSPDLLLVDGKLKYLEGDLRGAQRLLAEYVKTADASAEETLEARMAIADIGAKTGQIGLARENIRAIAQARPFSPEVLLVWAGIESQMQDRKQATELYKRVLDVDPGNKTAVAELKKLEALSGSAKLDDPVMQRLVEAERLARGTPEKIGDEAAALTWLEQGLEPNKYDLRLVSAIVRMKLVRNDSAGAIAVLEAALKAKPGDKEIQGALDSIRSVNTLESAIAAVDAAPASAVDKAWAKFQLYGNAGKTKEADAALAEAAAASADDPRVIEAQFARAIIANDLAQAERLMERAVTTDADRADGDTYKARMMLAKGNFRDAVLLLQKAAEKGNANPAVFRTLGLTQLQLGRGPDAIASFRRALELSPADPMTIRMYLSALVQLGQQQEALSVARQSEMNMRGDAAFINDWLRLESMSGNTNFALNRREQIRQKQPKDRLNNVSLAELYIEGKQWDKARAIIDELRKEEDELGVVTLDATWSADRGDQDGARKVFVDYIASLGTGEDAKPKVLAAYMTLGQFLIGRGQLETGLAAMRQAAKYQDPKTCEVDVALGTNLLNAGQYAEAEKSFRSALAGGVDDSGLGIRKRLIEALIQQGKFADAEKVFVEIGPKADQDIELLCQRAENFRASGDPKKAHEILDQTISKYPDEWLPYLRRARLVMVEPDMTRDALADLATVIKLRPNQWQALRTRGRILQSQGRFDDAIKDYQAAADGNPSIEIVRFELIGLLMSQDRENDAVNAAEAGIKLRPNDVRFIRSTGDQFTVDWKGRTPPQIPWNRAAQFYKQIWQQVGDADSAALYINALLSQTPPAIKEAEQALATPGLNVEKSWQLLMARASIRKQQGKEDLAKKDAMAGFDACGTDVRAIAFWHDKARQIFGLPATLAMLKAVRPPPAIKDWITLFQGGVMIDDPAMRSEGIAVLQQMSAPERDKSVRLSALRTLAATYQTESKWEEATVAYRTALEITPNDTICNNNLALLLAEKLNRPKDALPFAEKAATLEPTSGNIQDTLATTYWNLGDQKKAIEIQTGALRLARTEADKAEWSLKMAQWKFKAGDRAGATMALKSVRELMSDNPSVAAKYKAEFERVEREISAP